MENGPRLRLPIAAPRRARYSLFVESHDLRHVPVARSLVRQIIGLIGQQQRADLLLLIPHCRVIHTWFMRSAIDIVFLDGSQKVLEIVEGGRPWRIFRGPRSGRFVLELPPGHAREIGLSVGDTANLGER
jgi:uncharacterized membrane protein (UPF0127 family)